MEKKFTILVVDDEPEILSLLKDLLERRGYRTLTAINGIDALGVVEKHAVDLVLADLKMPGMNGFKLVEKLQKNQPQIRIVVMSGYGQQVAPMVTQMGIEHYIVKPIDFDEMLDLFDSLLK